MSASPRRKSRPSLSVPVSQASKSTGASPGTTGPDWFTANVNSPRPPSFLCMYMPRTNADLTKQPPEFYKQFNLIICGLDSIDARRWINR